MRMKDRADMRKNDGTARGRVVLVGAYKGGQLRDWPGEGCNLFHNLVFTR